MLVGLLFLVLAATPAAHADHDWGHRYMVYGRVLDATGEPAGHVPVRVSVETIKSQDPYITVTTDCQGIYYTLKQRTDTAGAYGEAPDWGVSDKMLYIHEREFQDRGNHHVRVYQEDQEIFHGAWRLDPLVQRSVQNIQLDTDVPPADGCAASAWNGTYIVTGRIQTEKGREEGRDRHDAMTIDGEAHTVKVRLATRDGPRDLDVQTNEVGDYFAVFEDVEVVDGGRVEVRYGDTEEDGRVDTTFRMTAVDIFEDGPPISMTTLTILLSVAGIMLFGGVAIWGLARRRRPETVRED